MARYFCKHCGQTIVRDSKKAWIKSYCDWTGKMVHITRIKRRK